MHLLPLLIIIQQNGLLLTQHLPLTFIFHNFIIILDLVFFLDLKCKINLEVESLQMLSFDGICGGKMIIKTFKHFKIIYYIYLCVCVSDVVCGG